MTIIIFMATGLPLAWFLYRLCRSIDLGAE